MPPGQGLRRFVHPIEIHAREGVEIGKRVRERVFHPVQEVGVFALHGVEAGMEIRCRRSHLMNHHGTGQDGI